MMKNLMKITSIMIVILLAISTGVFAASDSYEVTLKASPMTVKKGDSIKISVGLDKIAIESGEKGIGAYSAKLQYDTSIFEVGEIKGSGKWETPIMQNGAFTSTTNDATCVNTTQDIAIITLKVKENAAIGNTTIQITDFSASNGENDISTNNKSVTVKIEKEEENDNKNEMNNNTTGDKNEIGKNNTTNNNTTGKNTTNNIDNTTSGNKIPQTGNSDGMMWATISVLVIVSVISFIRYQKLNK